MPEKKKEIEVVVVVSGQPERIDIGAHQKLQHLVHEALRRSGNQGQPPSDWDLRTESGQLLDQHLTVADAHLENGVTLFLSPQAGAGG